MTLTEFLLARIAEDEAAARRAIAGDVNELPFIACQCGRKIHLGVSSPARVLAECEAKRRVAEDYGPGAYFNGSDPMDRLAYRWLCLLAEPYADHPDYRQEWRP